MTPRERVSRAIGRLGDISDEHGLGPDVSRRMLVALTQIGPEEMGKLMFAAGVINELRQFVDIAEGALRVAERLAAEREAEEGLRLLTQEPRP